jgi:hypothetical protein
MNVETWLAVMSALAAFASFLINRGLVARQAAMQFESLKAQMDADILAWAHEATDALSEGVTLAKGRGFVFDEGEMRRRLFEVSQRLSSLADRGRLFFPNIPGAKGGDKEGAFQGRRQPILDAMVFACIQVERMEPRNTGPDQAAAEYLTKCRRLMISEVQAAIDPRRRREAMKQISKQDLEREGPSFEAAAALGETLEERYPGVLGERRGADWIAERRKDHSSRR